MHVSFYIAVACVFVPLTLTNCFDISICLDASSSTTCRFLSPYASKSSDKTGDCTNAFNVYSSTQDYIRRRLQFSPTHKPTAKPTVKPTSVPTASML